MSISNSVLKIYSNNANTHHKETMYQLQTLVSLIEEIMVRLHSIEERIVGLNQNSGEHVDVADIDEEQFDGEPIDDREVVLDDEPSVIEANLLPLDISDTLEHIRTERH